MLPGPLTAGLRGGECRGWSRALAPAAGVLSDLGGISVCIFSAASCRSIPRRIFLLTLSFLRKPLWAICASQISHRSERGAKYSWGPSFLCLGEALSPDLSTIVGILSTVPLPAGDYEDRIAPHCRIPSLLELKGASLGRSGWGLSNRSIHVLLHTRTPVTLAFCRGIRTSLRLYRFEAARDFLPCTLSPLEGSEHTRSGVFPTDSEGKGANKNCPFSLF